jgi:hypothetical protein
LLLLLLRVMVLAVVRPMLLKRRLRLRLRMGLGRLLGGRRCRLLAGDRSGLPAGGCRLLGVVGLPFGRHVLLLLLLGRAWLVPAAVRRMLSVLLLAGDERGGLLGRTAGVGGLRRVGCKGRRRRLLLLLAGRHLLGILVRMSVHWEGATRENVGWQGRKQSQQGWPDGTDRHNRKKQRTHSAARAGRRAGSSSPGS